MGTLKELIAEDMDRIFLNQDEFGGIVVINGNDIEAVIGANEATSAEIEAGILERISIIVKTDAINPLPVVGQQLDIDGDRVQVTVVAQVPQKVKITWERYSS